MTSPVKCDISGLTVLAKNIRGSNGDAANDITADPQGNVMIAAVAYSNDGDMSHNNGGTDPAMMAEMLNSNRSGLFIWLDQQFDKEENSKRQTSSFQHFIFYYHLHNLIMIILTDGYLRVANVNNVSFNRPDLMSVHNKRFMHFDK